MIIGNKLNWSTHISHVKNKISKCVGILLKARIYLSRKCLLDLYQAFAYHYLIYCVELWGHSSDSILRPIFLVEKKIVRIISFSAFLAHTRPILLKLNLLPLCKVVIQKTSIFMYKLMNNMLPAALNYLIVRNNDISQYNTRQSHQLHGTRPTCKSVAHSFSTRIFQIWNSMSNVIDSHNSLFSFKYKTKAFLLNNELFLTM